MGVEITKQDFYKRFIVRPLSYSQLSAWEYNKDEWYERYILNKKTPANSAMRAGTLIGDSIGTEKSLVPLLTPPGVKEYELRASLGDIHIVGYCDHYCPDTKTLHENKTSTNRNKWNQRSVDEHKQLDMYALMLFLTHDVLPDDLKIYLNYIPVIEGADMRYYLPDPVEHYSFQTSRSEKHLVDMTRYIENTVEDMCAYAVHKDTLHTQEPVV